MKPFYVINFDINARKFEQYDVMPYFVNGYKSAKQKPKTFDEFKKFVEDKSRYRFWSRCEYEIIVSDWPPNGISEKWDVHRQLMMNIDIVTQLLMDNVKKKSKLTIG